MVRRHKAHEFVEQVSAVLRSRRALGMKLHRKQPVFDALHALDRAVQQIFVSDFESRARQTVPVYGIAVVLACDFQPARFKVSDGVVAAAMTEFELEGLCAVSKSRKLMSQTNAENGISAADFLSSSAVSGTSDGSPGPLEKNTPSGDKAAISSAAVSNGTTVTLQPRALRHLTILSFMPQSTATTSNLACAVRENHFFPRGHAADCSCAARAVQDV